MGYFETNAAAQQRDCAYCIALHCMAGDEPGSLHDNGLPVLQHLFVVNDGIL